MIKSDAKVNARQVWTWYRTGFDGSSKCRKEATTNCAYYDNDQWTEEDRKELEDRKQPCTTVNRVKPTIDLVIGTESKAQVDFFAAPRGDADVQDAGIATEALKYVMDQNQGEFLCSEVFKSKVKAGWGFIEVSENDDPFGEIVKLDFVPRNDLVWDLFAKKYDLSDGKFMIRPKWLELEDAIAKFPRVKDKLEGAVNYEEEEDLKDSPVVGTEDKADRPGVSQWDKLMTSSVEWLDRSRKRVKLLECWYKVPEETWIVENELTGDVDELDPNQMMEILLTPGTRITKKTLRKVRICIVAGNEVVEDQPSPYRHNQYPFVPFWAYRRDKDGMPYSLISQLRDLQDEINKRRSKAMHLLNSRQIIADSDAIDQKQNDWKDVTQQVATADGVVLLDSTKSGHRFEIVNQQAQIEAQFRFEEEAKREIEEAGVNREMRGLESNASSGRAIIARQVQGNTMLAEIFDNFRQSKLILGELTWAMIQQYWTKPKMIRVTEKGGEYKFLEVNKYLTDGTQILIQNDITKSKVDIVIDEQVYHQTIRQAMQEQMMEMISKLPPDIGLLLLDIVISYSDIPKKDEIIQRIQMVQGIAQQRQDTEDQLKKADAQVKIASSQQGGAEKGSSSPASSEKNSQNPVDSPQAIAMQMMGGL